MLDRGIIDKMHYMIGKKKGKQSHKWLWEGDQLAFSNMLYEAPIYIDYFELHQKIHEIFCNLKNMPRETKLFC